MLAGQHLDLSWTQDLLARWTLQFQFESLLNLQRIFSVLYSGWLGYLVAPSLIGYLSPLK